MLCDQLSSTVRNSISLLSEISCLRKALEIEASRKRERELSDVVHTPSSLTDEPSHSTADTTNTVDTASAVAGTTDAVPTPGM